MPRKQQRALTRTYITPAMIEAGQRYKVRFVDARTGEEARCSRPEVGDALSCAREKVIRPDKPAPRAR